ARPRPLPALPRRSRRPRGRVVQDRRPGRGDGGRAPRALPSHRPLGPQHPDPVLRAAARDRRALPRGRPGGREAHDRPHDDPDRPARAGAELPEPAGDHEGQRHDRHRRGPLLPDRRSAEGDLRRPEPALRPRDADAHHAAQHRRRDGAGRHARQPRPDQRPHARGDRGGGDQLGRRRDARRAAVDRPAARHPAVDGAADAGRARAPRRGDQRRGQQARADPRGGGRAREPGAPRRGRARGRRAARTGPGRGAPGDGDGGGGGDPPHRRLASRGAGGQLPARREVPRGAAGAGAGQGLDDLPAQRGGGRDGCARRAARAARHRRPGVRHDA
ncbi:MAG: Protein QmcA (possibly involved in integral membrane quality control), partial [uncultured Solirubrobacteraceae bacterium]